MVDDASTDLLAKKIKEKYLNQDRVQVIHSVKNSGKAEALRLGIRNVSLDQFDFIGFTDADFSAPSSEILNAFEIAKFTKVDLLHATRIETKTNSIKTSSFRKNQGALFHFLVSKILKFKSRDSQCGLKVYKSDLLKKLNFEIPFHNPWLFDLELLLRIPNKSSYSALEYPLSKWSHKPASKMNFHSVVLVPFHLVKLRLHYGTLHDLFFSKG